MCCFKSISSTLGKLLLTTICCMVGLVCLYAQQVSVTANKDKIVLGEPVTITLKVDDVDLKTKSIQQWFNVQDSYAGIEVMQRAPIDTIVMKGLVSYVQKIQITSFDSGFWQLPALSVLFSNQTSLATNPIGFTALPVDVSNLKDYHDVKDILPVEDAIDVQTWLLCGAIALLLLALFIWLFKKKKPMPKVAPVAKPTNLLQHYLEALETLEQQQLLQQGKQMQYYDALLQIVKQFYGDWTQTKTDAITAAEFIVKISAAQTRSDVQLAWIQTIQLAQAVKFAKYIPSMHQGQEAIAVAKQFLKTCYAQNK